MYSKKTVSMTKLVMSLVIIFSTHFVFAQGIDKALEAQADTLVEHQEYDKAVGIYSKIIAKSKTEKTHRIQYKRAVCYYYLGEFQKAVDDVTQFIPEYPQSHQAYILRALAYRQLGDLDNQLKDIEKATELQAGNTQLIKWRGSLYIEKGEFAKGKDDLLLAKAFEDDAELETNLGMAYQSLGNSQEAINCFNQSIVLDVTYSPAYLYAGNFLLEEAHYEKALVYFDLLLRLEPDNASALFYRGVTLVELKREKEGCRCLQKAFSAGQDDALGYLKEYCYDVFK
jgi:tetratricopeptide (TPR) repeat protein